MKTRIIDCARATRAELLVAARALRGGAVIVFPTDTVYAIGASALNSKGCGRIYRLKKRPAEKSLPVFVHSVGQAKKIACWNAMSAKLARRFWPGPLTMVLKTKSGVRLHVGAAETVGVRRPDHPFLRKWLRLCVVPVAQTSANLSGQPALRGCAAIIEKFDGQADYIFTAGDTDGLESTVVDLTGETPRLLREGAISKDSMLSVLSAEK
ncbi:MAG: L-threonylcarbamoyladenylate synthase [Elusimicrobiales bacterium]|nr:L-threonylcarbamoyladenylate synthase [Elusimicrobiales bacterium]